MTAFDSPARLITPPSSLGRSRVHPRPAVRLAVVCTALAVLGALPGAGVVRAEGPVIERIDVEGNRRLTDDAFIFASGLKVGDPYDPAEARRAFRRLWEKGLFEDLTVEAQDGEKGKILVFRVKERPILVSIEYDTVRSITRSNIEDMFKQRGLDLSVGKPLDKKSIWKAEEYIKDLLGSKGYLDAQAEGEPREISENSTAIHFKIRQGPRTRIKKITFVGNQIFSSRKLRRTLKNVREHNLYTQMTGKDLWRPGLYDQEVQKLFELYRSYGYLDVEIKPPVVEILDPGREKREAKEAKRQQALAEKAAKAAEKAAKKKKRPPRPGAAPVAAKEPNIRRWVYLTVKVKDGPQYRTGEIKVKGNTVFTDKEILQRVLVRPGYVLNDGVLQFSLDRLRAEYGSRGYIYATATKSVVRREGNIADVTIEIDEDHPYKIDRIEFEGNSVTRDLVLRREMRLNEGELLNRSRLDISGFKIQQLGFVKPDPDPLIEPVEGAELARIRIKLEEQGRNEIQVGGGYSGLDGFFFSGSYATRNFLGRGEVLSVALQVGGRSDRYQLSFREPWFLGKPYLFGFSIFRRDTRFAEDQSRSGSGGSLLLGRQLTDFSQAQILYSFEKVSFVDRSSTTLNSSLAESDTTIGSLTPSYSFDRVNDPFRPTSGYAVFVSSQIAGSAFGGTNNFFKPQIQGTKYFPGPRRTFFALHGEAGYLVPFGAGAVQGGRILDVPRFERFYIGGDLLGPRVFETRTIGPIEYVTRDGTEVTERKRDIVRYKRGVLGQPFQVFCDLKYDFSPQDGLCNALSRDRIGGNRFFLTQFEYAIPLAQPFIIALFVDTGNAYAENQRIDFQDVRVSTGVEARIFLPVFQAPIRFIFGKALRKRPEDTTNSFQFSIGTSF